MKEREGERERKSEKEKRERERERVREREREKERKRDKNRERERERGCEKRDYFKTGPLQCLRHVPQRLNVLSHSYDTSHAGRWSRAHCSSTFWPVLRTSSGRALHTLMILKTYLYSKVFILVVPRIASCLDVDRAKLHRVLRWSSNRLHRESTLRFIPKGCEVPRVLIHLFSRILRRQAWWLYSWSIATAVKSASVRPTPLRCFATEDSSVLLCLISK